MRSAQRHIFIMLVIALTVMTRGGVYSQTYSQTSYPQFQVGTDNAIDHRYLGGDWSFPRFDSDRTILSRLYVDLGVSILSQDNTSEFATNRSSQLQINYGVGYRFSPVHSVAFTVRRSDTFAYSAGYYMNINNIVLHGDHRSRVEFSLGASLDYVASGVNSLGVSSSLRVQYNLTNCLGIYAEPKVSVYKSAQSDGYGLNSRPSINFGLTYAFNKPNHDLVVPVLLKTNLLYDLAITPNIGVEVPVGDRVSITANVMRGWWLIENTRAWQLQSQDLGARVWLGNRDRRERLTGWFVGAFASAGFCDFQFEDIYGVQADIYYATAVSGGYGLQFNNRWGLEAEFGFGYLVCEYQNYRVVDDDYLVKDGFRMRYSSFMPVKASIALTYRLFTKRKR